MAITTINAIPKGEGVAEKLVPTSEIKPSATCDNSVPLSFKFERLCAAATLIFPPIVYCCQA